MNKIFLPIFILFACISCTEDRTIDPYQKILINDVWLPVFISASHFQCNVMLSNKDKISEFVDYYKSDDGHVHHKYLYKFNKGKLKTVFKFEGAVQEKISVFEYDTIGRLKTIERFKGENRIINFNYSNNGLVDRVTNENGDSFFDITYHYGADDAVVKIDQYYPQKGITNTYNLIKTDLQNKSYLMKFSTDNELRYDSIPFSFYPNGIMKEVDATEYDSNGIPIRLNTRSGVYDIETKVDSLGNWTFQNTGATYSNQFREFTYH